MSNELHAEVVAIGDELTSGQRLDTNSQWLSQRLGEIGLRVLFHTTVADELDANIRVFREATDRAEVVIATGGLGPTADDLTRQAIAQATNKELRLDEESLRHIRRIFSQRKREMPRANEIQAYFPATSRVIPNPHGTAPGIDIEVPSGGRGNSRIFALPGVPAEMKQMWQHYVRPSLERMMGGSQRLIHHRRVKCFGVGESDLEQMLPNLIRRGRQPTVGITVSEATITLRITAEGSSVEACQAAMQPTMDTIHQTLGTLVFGEEDEELQDAVIRLLRSTGRTLATAECGTGGLVSSWLADADHANRSFRGAVVVRDLPSLSTVLTLDESLLSDVDPLSDSLLLSAAEQVRHRFAADFGLVIGPLPTAAGDARSARSLRCGLAGPEIATVNSFSVAGHPAIIRARSAKQGLNLLRLFLAEQNQKL